MATTPTQTGVRAFADRLFSNRMLAAAATLLFVVAAAAILKGRSDWPQIPRLVWLHLGSVLTATALTPIMLLRRKGDDRHRTLGYAWVTAMVMTAATSLAFKTGVAGPTLGVFSGDFSPIHLLSIYTLLQVPLIVARARRHNWAGHERAVRSMVIGALLVAGFFTFPFDRMLGAWLFA